jgi:NAD-dependent dihydropyrimidine dehydrogenase PreA subunit
MKGREIVFDRNSCWSCTICANHCPVGAITLERISQGG